MESKAVRRAEGRWLRGSSGNPKGRPTGRQNKSTVYLQQLLAGKTEQVIQAVIDAAISGDMRAAKLVLERVLPLGTGRPLDEEIACAIGSAEDAAAAIASIASAAIDGRLSSSEAADLASVVESYGRAVQTVEVVARLDILEQRAEQRDAHRDGQGHAR
jgi:hypothetical protein